ncbi:MAG TPA: lipoyl(octanoyl) transferase LipB [Burkholderiaceae bacterium]|nr:lipoyl(octanoyl) transferase LipB [Burkholderiaceae bacterium]
MDPVVRHLGRAEYAATWGAMREFTARRDASTPDELWVVEHPPVFTLGVAARAPDVCGPIPVVATDRGGQVTYHGPGQVVVYTLIDLRRLGIFVKELVYRIEQSAIQALDALGVAGCRVRGAPGVYVAAGHGGERIARETDLAQFSGLAKIAALGIKVTRGCSYHGVALNVAMDLTPFGWIDPCGYRGLRAIDLATLGVPTTWDAAAALLVERLRVHLSPGP